MELGNRTEDSIIDFKWSTNSAAGAAITRATNGTVSVYKGNNTTQTTAGVTDTEDFDSVTGVHHCRIDTSADAFYAVDEDYDVVLSAATIDGQTVNVTLAHFRIERGFAEVDVVKWLGAAVATPTVSGVPEVDQTHLNGVAVQAASGYQKISEGTGTGQLSLTSGGVLLGNTNHAIGALAVGGGVAVTQSTLNGHGFTVSGNGTGSAMRLTNSSGSNATLHLDNSGLGATVNVTGSTTNQVVQVTSPNGGAVLFYGATGVGLHCSTAGSGSYGLYAQATSDGYAFGASGGIGMQMEALATNQPAIVATGNGSGAGAHLIGGATGHGLHAQGGATSGDGFRGTVTSGNPFSAAGTSLSTLTSANVKTQADQALADAGVNTTAMGRLDATVSSRATPAQVNTEADTALSDAGVNTTAMGRLDAAVSTRATPAQVKTQADQALADAGVTTTVMLRLDVAVSSRLAGTSYTAPDNAGIASAAASAATAATQSTAAASSAATAATQATASATSAASADSKLSAQRLAKIDAMTFTVANRLDVQVMGLQQAALAQFITTDTGETTAANGSVAKISQGAAGGNVTVGDVTQAALAKFVTVNTGESSAAAGSVAKLSQGAGGGGTPKHTKVTVKNKKVRG